MAIKLFRTDASTGGGFYKGYEKSLKQVEEEVAPVRDADVAIFSLMSGRGVTHTAAALANFLSEDSLNHVALFSDELANDTSYRKEMVRSDVMCLANGLRAENARRYNACVEDAGVVGGRRELPNARKLIMVCTPDRKYMTALADFASERSGQSRDIYYLFNVTPESKTNEIKHLMDYYKFAGCVYDVYDAKKAPRTVKLLFKNILLS